MDDENHQTLCIVRSRSDIDPSDESFETRRNHSTMYKKPRLRHTPSSQASGHELNALTGLLPMGHITLSS